MTTAAMYMAVFLFTMQNGEQIIAEDEASGLYPTHEQCLLQAEADAKGLAREWEWNERRTGLPGFFKAVSVRCERVNGPSGSVGKGVSMKNASKGGRHHGR